LHKSEVADMDEKGEFRTTLLQTRDNFNKAQKQLLILSRYTNAFLGPKTRPTDKKEEKIFAGKGNRNFWLIYWVAIALLGTIVFKNIFFDIVWSFWFFSFIMSLALLFAAIPYREIDRTNIHCRKCGHYTYFDAKFCQSCGTSTVLEEPPPFQATIKCPKCEEENRKEFGKSYCWNCGQKL